MESSSDIVLSCIPEYKDYRYDEKHDIWAIVSLMAPELVDHGNKERAEMDLVAVMDISGSMAGEKLSLVKTTLEFVVTQLTEKDRLSLITFETHVNVEFELMNMNSDKKAIALEKIKGLYTKQCTNLSGGLFKGFDEITNRNEDGKSDVTSILLFTDGIANRGMTNTSEIVAELKRRYGVDQTKKKQFRHGTRKSSRIKDTNSRKRSASDDNSSLEETRVKLTSDCADTTVYTFGFGHDTDTNMLKQISEAGNGMYYFIETKEKIGESFAHCLGGLMSTVAQKINLEMNFLPGVSVKEVHSAKLPEIDGRNVKVIVGDMQSEEIRDIVLELSLDPLDGSNIFPGQLLVNTDMNYFNVITKQQTSLSSSLVVHRPRAESSRDDINVNIKVTKEKNRIQMNKAMKDADGKANRGNYEGAKSLLTETIDAMVKRRASLSKHYNEKELAEFDTMIKDLEECRTNTKSANVWHTKGRQMQTKKNMMQQYKCQRSSNASGRAYQTKMRSSAVSKCKQFKR